MPVVVGGVVVEGGPLVELEVMPCGVVATAAVVITGTLVDIEVLTDIEALEEEGDVGPPGLVGLCAAVVVGGVCGPLAVGVMVVETLIALVAIGAVVVEIGC